jgi:hypothetical protein
VQIDCKAGDRYLIKRVGKVALVVLVKEVHINMTSDGPGPKAFYVALTSKGTARRRSARWEPRRAVAWLTCRDGIWKFPHGERIPE